MKSLEVNSLGFTMTKSVPSTVEEYNSLAKRADGCLEDAIASTLYRGTFAEFRSIFLHGADADGDLPALEGLDKLTGIERRTKTTKSPKGEDVESWDETEAKFFDRIVAEKFSGDKDAAIAAYQSHAQAAMDRASFDPSAKERTSAGPKKVAKTYIAVAAEAVKSGKGQRLAELLGSYLGRAVTLIDGEGDEVVAKNVDILARAISDREAQKRAEREKEMKSEYAV